MISTMFARPADLQYLVLLVNVFHGMVALSLITFRFVLMIKPLIYVDNQLILVVDLVQLELVGIP